MVEYSLNFIEPLINGDVTTVEVKREAEEAYTKDVQKSLKTMVWGAGGCQSWYVVNGWNATVYPYSQIWFGLRCMFPKWSDWRISYTTKGLLKKRLGQLFKAVVATIAFVALRNMHESGDGLEYFRNLGIRYLLMARMKMQQRRVR